MNGKSRVKIFQSSHMIEAQHLRKTCEWWVVAIAPRGGKKKHPFFVEFSSTSRDDIGLLKILVVFSMFPRIGVLGIPSRKLTYPTWGKGKSSSNMPYQGDMLVSWRVCLRGPNTFSRGIWMSSKPSNFLCRIPLKFMTPSSGLGGTNLTSLNLRLGTVSF